MQTTVNVPAGLIDVFRSELEATAAQAADTYAETRRMRPEETERRKVELEQALAVEAPESPGDLTGPAHVIASTARGVLLDLVADLSNEADRPTLDTDLMVQLAGQVAGWVLEVDRLEAEAGVS